MPGLGGTSVTGVDEVVLVSSTTVFFVLVLLSSSSFVSYFERVL